MATPTTSAITVAALFLCPGSLLWVYKTLSTAFTTETTTPAPASTVTVSGPSCPVCLPEGHSSLALLITAALFFLAGVGTLAGACVWFFAGSFGVGAVAGAALRPAQEEVRRITPYGESSDLE